MHFWAEAMFQAIYRPHTRIVETERDRTFMQSANAAGIASEGGGLKYAKVGRRKLARLEVP